MARIAFINQPWDRTVMPAKGGPKHSLEIWTYEVARRLAKHHEVTVYYATKDMLKSQTDYDEGICYRAIPSFVGIVLSKLSESLERGFGYRNATRPFFASQWYFPLFIQRVAQDLAARQCDVVHLFNFSQFVPVIRAWNPHIQIFLHMQCEWLTQLDHRMIAPRLAAANRILGCSDYITNEIRARFPQFRDRCATVLNGADIEKFTLPKDDQRANRNTRRLLYVGRLSPEKGVHVILDAFRKVLERLPDAELEIVGPPGEQPFEFLIPLSHDGKTIALTRFYNPETEEGRQGYYHYIRNQMPPQWASRVTFSGFIPQRELAARYHAADVFVFPSVWHEPFGMPLVEAMAYELPVIATRSGGMPEIVEEGKTGLLVERDDSDALADAMLRLLENRDLRLSMGKFGRQRMLERFTWERIADQWLHEYELSAGAVAAVHPAFATR